MNEQSTQNQENTELNQSCSSLKSNSNADKKVFIPASSSIKKNRKIIRVLIAEDQYTIQQIWQSYLEPVSDIEIIGTAIDGQAAIELVKQLKPDVVLMDINMPRMDGLTATEIIANQYVNIKILILSFSACDRDIKKSLQVGATGYLLKSIDPQELATAIRSINKGYCQLGPGLIGKLDFDTSPVLNQKFNLASRRQELEDDLSVFEDKDGVGKSSSEKMDIEELVDELETITFEKANTSSSNSVLILPQKKYKKLLTSNFGLLLLLLSGLLVFLLTPSGRNWWSKLPILSTFQSGRAVTAQNFSSATTLPVKTIKVTLVDSYQVDRIYTGTIVSRRSSSLSFERAGKLLNLTVDLGEQVKVGTSLAMLDTQNLKAKQKELLAERKQVKVYLQELLAGSRSETLAAAQSMVKSLHSQLKLAQTKSQRRQKLYTSGAISREQFDEASTEVNVLQARLNEAQNKFDELLAGTRPEKISAQQALLEQLDAKLTSLEVELEQSILKAPFTGTIAKRSVDEGTVVSAGESIFTIVETQNLEVHVGVPIDSASQIPIGSNQPLQIGSRTYQAKVLSILPQLDSATRTLTVVLGLNESASREVRAGQVARLKLSETITDSGYWLPTTALVRGVRGLWSCYVLANSENLTNDSQKTFRVEKQDIEILQTESNRVFVRGTIQNNDLVIVNGNHRLVIGQLVRPIASPNKW